MTRSFCRQKQPGNSVYKIARAAALVLTISLFNLSCSKSDTNDDDDDPATPRFEFELTGALSKKVTGTYAIVQYEDYVSPASGNMIYGMTVALSSPKQEFVSMGIGQEGKPITPGKYNIDYILSPFFSSFANYTEDQVKIYGPVSGTITISSISSKHIAATFDVIVEDAGSTLNIKGKYNAVIP